LGNFCYALRLMIRGPNISQFSAVLAGPNVVQIDDLLFNDDGRV
jgi:hypothetical protein